MRQRLRAVGLFALAIVAITCTDAPTSPTKIKSGASGVANIRMSPSFSPDAARIYKGLAAFGLSVTEVHVVLTGPDGSKKDTVIAFPASQDQITIEIPVPSSATDQAFDALVELRNDQHVVLFSGHQTVIARAANLPTQTPPLVVISYTGPGKGTKTVTVLPPDTTIAGTTTVGIRATAIDSAGLPVPNLLVQFAVSDATLAVVTSTGDATGTLTGLGKRGTATLSAITPTNITGTSRITFVPPAARIVVISGNGQTGAAGSTLAQQLVVEVQATDNLPVPGASVTFRAVTAGGSVQQATVVAGANGRASTALTLGTVAGAYVYEAGSGALPPVSVSATATAAPAAAIAIVSGDAQTDTIGKLLPLPFVVRVTDQFGGVVTGATVSWTRTAGNGILGATSTSTGVNGTTSIAYTLGATASNDTVRASVAGVTGSVLFSAKAVSRVASTIAIISGGNQSGAPNTALQTPLVARVSDAQNNPIAGATVTWSATGAGATFNPASGTTDAQGQVSTQATLGATPGSTTVTATVGTSTATTTLTTSAPSQPTLTIVAGNGQSATAGTTVPVAPSALVKDATGNPMVDVQVTFAVATGGGTIVGGNALTDNSGVATLGSWTLGTTPGLNVLTATFGSLSVTFSATGTAPAGPSHLVFVQGPPSPFVIGAPPVTISVRLFNGQNNPVPQSGVVVTMTGTAFPGPNFPVLTATTDNTGTATFTVPTYNGAPGTVALDFSAAGITGIQPPAIPIVAGTGTKLLIVTQPSAAVVNQAPFTSQPVVQLADAAGNPVSASGIQITATFASGPTSPTPVLIQAAATTNANGQATFAGMAINGAFGVYTLSFSAPGYTAVVSNAITNGAGPANTLQLLGGNGQNAPVSTAVAVPPLAKVIDAQSNGVPGVVVTFNATTAGSTVSNGTTTGSTVTVTTNALGIAQLTAWTMSSTAGPHAVTATATVPNGSPVTFTANATTAGAAKFILTQPLPTQIVVGAPIAPFQIQIADANNNPVAQANVSVTVAGVVQPANINFNFTLQTNAQGIVNMTLSPYVGPIGNEVITISASGFTTLTSASIPVVAGPPFALRVFSQPSTSAQSGVPLVAQPVVRLVDEGLNSVATAGIPVTATVAGATLSGTTTVNTNASGQAVFTNLALAGAVGSYNLVFSSGSLNPATSGAITLAAGTAASMSIVAGDNQTAAAGGVVPLLPAVVVKDAGGNPVAGVAVLFTAVTPGSFVDDVTSKTIQTNAQGIAQLSFAWMLASTAGANTMTASAAGVAGSPLTFHATGTPGTAAGLKLLQAVPASITVGLPFPAPVQVQLVDQNDNPVSQGGVVVTATANVQPSNTTFALNATTASNGIATFNVLPYTGTIGTMIFTLTASSVSTLVTPGITVLAGSPSKVVITTQPPATAASGAPFVPQPALQVTDVGSNAVNASSNIAATIQTGSGTLGGTSTIATNASGAATFSNLSLSGAPGSFTLRFAASGLTAAVSNTIALGAGGPAAIVINAGNGQVVAAGTTVPIPPSVRVNDGSGNPLSGLTVTFAAVFGGGTVTGATAVTNASGIATVGTWTLGTIAGTNNVTATVGALTANFQAIGVAGPAAKLALTTPPPATASSGAPLTPQPQVQRQDQFGNSVQGAGVVITASVLTGSGTLTNATATTTAAGLATFSGLTISGPAGALTLDFTSPGVTHVASSTITLGGGAAAAIAKSAGDGQTAAAGTNVAIAPSVLVTDGAGNPVAGVAVTFAPTLGGGSTPAGSVLTNASGIATAISWQLGISVGANNLTASAGALSTTFTATAVAGPPNQLIFVNPPPPTATSGVPLSVQPAVQRKDQFGNNVNGGGILVTASILSGNGTLTNATATTNAGGLAIFTGMTITGTAGTFTLDFNSAGVTHVASSGIVLSGGTASAITKSAGDNQTAAAGTSVATAPSVLVTDGAGNPLAGVQVTFTPTAGGGSVTGSPATTNASGIATVGSWQLGAALGGNSLTATAGALTTTFAATAVPGPAAKLAFVTPPPTTASSGSALSPQPSVQRQDQFGNSVAGGGVAVTASVLSGSGTLTNATATTNAAGLATFSGLTITGTAGTLTLDFTSAGVTHIASSGITLGGGSAAAIAKSAGDGQTAAAGTNVAVAPSVLVTDGAGNPVAGVAVTFAPTLGGGSTPAGSVLTNASGIATAISWQLGTSVGANNLTASAGALSTTFTATAVAGPAAQFAFVIAPPTTATSGAPLSPQPSVQVQDNFGNPVAASGLLVSASFLSGSGTLANATASTNASGLATFTGLTISGAPGSVTLQFGSGTLTHAVSAPITLSGGTAAALVKSAGDGQTAIVASNVAVDPAVLVTDASGNPVVGVQVTFTVASGGGAVVGTPATTNASGIAQVSSWQLGTIAGPNSLTATLGALTTTFTATGVAAPPAALTITTQPTTSTSGAALSPQPVIQVRDQFGNATGASGTVTAVITSGTGTLNNPTTGIGTGGVATFGALTFNGSGTFTLQFQSGSLTPVSSSPITQAAGPAVGIAFSVSPTGGTGGVAFSPAVTVRLVDAQSNTVTSNNTNTVTLSIAAGTGTPGATLAGAGPVTFVNGVATFPAAAIDFGGTGYFLRANTNALTQAGAPIPSSASGTFNVAPGPGQLLSTKPGNRVSVAQVGAINPPTVTRPIFVARNAQGNPAAGLTVSVTAFGRCRLDTGNGLFTTLSFTSDVNGEVTPLVRLPSFAGGSGCLIKASGASFTTATDSSQIAVFPAQTSHVWTGAANSNWQNAANWIPVISAPSVPSSTSDNVFIPNYNPTGIPVVPVVSGPKPAMNRLTLDSLAQISLGNIGIDIFSGGVAGWGLTNSGSIHIAATATVNGIFDILDAGQSGVCGTVAAQIISLRDVSANVLNVRCKTNIDTTAVVANTVNVFQNGGQGWLHLTQSRAAMAVSGNANFTGDSLWVTGGVITVSGTATFGGSGVNWSGGTLNAATNAVFSSGHALYNGVQMLLQGNVTFGGANAGSQQLAGGQMTLLGNFTQVIGIIGGPGGLTFNTSSDHATVLAGSTTQTVSFASPTQSKFSVLRLQNTSAGGVQFTTSAQIVNGTTQPRVDIITGRLQLNSGTTFTLNSGGLHLGTNANLNLLGNIAGVISCSGRTTNSATITGSGLYNGTAYTPATCTP
ncbi:MAG: Ig-like domain-containing protein [Gemmatimonadaceae bacterium]